MVPTATSARLDPRGLCPPAPASTEPALGLLSAALAPGKLLRGGWPGPASANPRQPRAKPANRRPGSGAGVWKEAEDQEPAAGGRTQKLQKERLMNDFSSALNNFQVVQRRVSEKEKESIARARAGSRLSAEDRQREEQLVSFDSHEEWNQMQRQEDEAPITEQDLELIKERETAIRQLEADILDVNQIFKDLAMMIHDQGDLIDSIEANVESSEVHVERATDQLQRAAYYQKKSRKKMCILVLVLSVIITVLVVVIWVASK
ncbi:syntaxin-12-like [Meriones unguiculatus]|uniref:syntaxin-12-like n=1 Tax=Meriones unguiculatus TaxID=10047 RepID=UPI000B4F4B97|nr:syntaxin-12-like [Meriones unguiculatus]